MANAGDVPNYPRELLYVCGVSWPRSGHHLLVRILDEYFGGRFHYCEYYTPIDCCRCVPCERMGEISFSKSHDRNLEVPIRAGGRYLVQYREFCPAVVSDFELYVRDRGRDSSAQFRRFANKEARKYVRFMGRWASAQADGTTIARIAYEQLASNPGRTIADVISLFAPGEPVDRATLTSSIASAERITVRDGIERPDERRGVQASRDIRKFRYFDESFFRRLDRKTMPSYRRMAALPVVQHVGSPEGTRPSPTRSNRTGSAKAKIYVDATGTLSQRGVAPTGIPRIQDFLVRQALDDWDPSVRVIHFDMTIGCYRALTADEVSQISDRRRDVHPAGSELREAVETINRNPSLGREFDRYYAARISKRKPGELGFAAVKIAIRSYRSVQTLFRRARRRRIDGNSEANLKDGIVLMSHSAIFSSLFAATTAATERRAFICHDLIPWFHPEFIGDQQQAKRFVRRLQRLLHGGIHALCTSDTSRAMLADFVAETGVPAIRIDRFPVPSALFEIAKSLQRTSRLEPEEPFILYCSTVEIRKNHIMLLKIWKRALDEGVILPKLKLAGKWGWGVDDLQKFLNANPGLAGRIELLGPVSDSELIDLYRSALFGVMPSRIEGWGLSASECLDFGIPVVVSTAPALKEATRRLMPALDPDDEDAWYAEIRQLAECPAKRKALQLRIDEHYRPVAPRESWQAIKAALTEREANP